ncbi:MAG TPA: urease accessory protein UreE [Candidatus Caenarcaniphilales bacterium]
MSKPAVMILTLTERLPPNPHAIAEFTLALTAAERTRSRCRYDLANGCSLLLHLARGTVLQDDDLLQSQAEDTLVRVVAKPEPVLTATAPTALDLLRAAYHLGNRHVPLEITADYLRLSPDPVLRGMLEQLGLQVTESLLPFHPEAGAYKHHHAG